MASSNAQNLTERGITSVVSFCTRDLRFLKACIKPLALISKQIIVAVCDHFFDGTPEDRTLLNAIYAAYPDIEFIEFAYSEEVVYGTPARLVPSSPDWATHWHNTGRYIAYFFLKPESDFVLFCDVDEIFEEERFVNWLNRFPLKEYGAMRFATYWYFRKATLRALQMPDGPLLVKRALITPSLLLHPDERSGIFRQIGMQKQREILADDGRPLVHHFSWARPKKELIDKSRTWGHRFERNWEQLIEEEYRQDFTGRDFVRSYTYEEIVEPYFDPFIEPELKGADRWAVVHKVTPKQLFRLETAFLLNDV